MRVFWVAALALGLAPLAVPAKKSKTPKPPYQEDIVHGCLSVTHITKGTWGYSGSILGVVENHCDQPLRVTVTAAFYSGGNYCCDGTRKGDQLESDSASETVAAGANWRFIIAPEQTKTWAVGRIQIIEVRP